MDQQGNPILYYRIKIKGKEGLLECLEVKNPSLSRSEFKNGIVKDHKDSFVANNWNTSTLSIQLFRVFFYIFPTIFTSTIHKAMSTQLFLMNCIVQYSFHVLFESFTSRGGLNHPITWLPFVPLCFCYVFSTIFISGIQNSMFIQYFLINCILHYSFYVLLESFASHCGVIHQITWL